MWFNDGDMGAPTSQTGGMAELFRADQSSIFASQPGDDAVTAW